MVGTDGSVFLKTRPTIDIEKINGESISPQTSPFAVEREQVIKFGLYPVKGSFAPGSVCAQEALHRSQQHYKRHHCMMLGWSRHTLIWYNMPHS